jgi:predicted nucleotidyltransferase
MVIGSIARGDSYPYSDLDLYFLLNDGCQRDFYAEFKKGIFVEYKYADFKKAKTKLKRNPMEYYSYIDEKILYDRLGYFEELTKITKQKFENYSVPQDENKAILHWLKSALVKIQAAQNAGDELKAAFVTSTNSFQILQGIWIANQKPIPPNGAVLAHLKDITKESPFIESWVKNLFIGNNRVRIDTAVKTIKWIISHLEK